MANQEIRIGASYNRVSDDESASKENGSLGNQEFIGQEIADELTRKTGIEHKIEYVLTEEDGKSGGSTNRPQYQQLWDLVETRRIKFLVAKEISRLNRSIVDFCALMEHCRRNGVDVQIKGLNLDFNGPTGELIFKLLALMAEFERKLIIQRTREGIRAGMLKNGKIHGGRVLLGFDLVKDKPGVWAPNKAELQQVNRILEIVPQYDSLTTACEAINSEGIRNKYGTPFRPDALRRMVISKKYEGILEVRVATGSGNEKNPKREKIAERELPFGAVVDLEKLYAAREKLTEWDAMVTKTRRRNRTNLLAGILVHADGTPFRGTSGTRKDKELEYYYRHDKRKITLNAEELEQKIIDGLACYQNEREVQEYIAEATRQLHSNAETIDHQVLKLKDQIKEIRKREAGILDAMTGANKTARTGKWLDERLQEIEKERAEAEAGIHRLEREKQAVLASRPDPRNVKATLEYVFQNFRKAEPAVQRNLMRQVFEKIVVENKHQVKAYWRFPEIAKPAFPEACGAGGSGFSLALKWGAKHDVNIEKKTPLFP